MDVVEIVVVLTGVISVIVALVSALTSARRSAFEELRQVVDTLQKNLEDAQKSLAEEKKRRIELEAAFIDERNQRKKIETWARKLVRQLQVANIVPAEMEED